ncbi:MAG: TSUP family transporter [Angelakisella sp.]
MMVSKGIKAALGGVAVGILNGLLGAGGGMVMVPLMEWLGVKGKKSHATSLAVIVPLSVLSAGLYWWQGWFSPSNALPYLLPGLLGAVVGGLLMGKIQVKWLKIAFGLLLLWGGVKNIWI